MIDKKSPERTADALDVSILDLLAQVEALLRNVREVQRGALRLRGVLIAGNDMNPRDAAADIRHRIAEMQRDCEALQDALVQAADVAGRMEPVG